MQDATGHYEDECKWHIRCGPGEFMQGQSPSTKGTCEPCPANEYMHLFNHRETRCAAQPECAPGQGMSRDTPLAKRGCVDCDRGKSQNSEVHRTPCETCAEGKYSPKLGQREYVPSLFVGFICGCLPCWLAARGQHLPPPRAIFCRMAPSQPQRFLFS